MTGTQTELSLSARSEGTSGPVCPSELDHRLHKHLVAGGGVPSCWGHIPWLRGIPKVCTCWRGRVLQPVPSRGRGRASCTPSGTPSGHATADVRTVGLHRCAQVALNGTERRKGPVAPGFLVGDFQGGPALSPAHPVSLSPHCGLPWGRHTVHPAVLLCSWECVPRPRARCRGWARPRDTSRRAVRPSAGAGNTDLRLCPPVCWPRARTKAHPRRSLTRARVGAAATPCSRARPGVCSSTNSLVLGARWPGLPQTAPHQLLPAQRTCRG